MSWGFAIALTLGAAKPVYLEETAPVLRKVVLGPHTAFVSEQVEVGALLVVDVLLSGACQAPSLRWQGRSWPGYPVGDRWRVAAPVALGASNGLTPVTFECDGIEHRFQVDVRPLVVRLSRIERRAPRGRVELKTHRRFGKPPLSRLRREGRALAKAFAKASSVRLWSQQFLRPASGIDTSAFGAIRRFRGQRSTHQGLDISGTPIDTVHAANEGRVLIVADDFFFIGNAVVIDHGAGLLTLYFHLNSVSVREGATVKRGEVLGTIGQTGRVTGPHLHFGVRYHGRYVDPNDMLRFVPDAPLPGALIGEMLMPERGESFTRQNSPHAIHTLGANR